MSFETKYLIRWGIPGWILIVFIGSALIYSEPDMFDNINWSSTDAIGLLVSLGFFGVPVGYLMHQVYFSWHWVIKKKRIFDEAVKYVVQQDRIKTARWGFNDERDYFRFEYVWQAELLKLDVSEREYISQRYRHLLSTIHGLGALIVSLGISFLFGLVKGIIEKDLMSIFMIIYLLITGFLTFACFRGFKYYSANLNYFQGNFLNAFFDKEFVREKQSFN